MITIINGFNLQSGIANSLEAKLTAAHDSATSLQDLVARCREVGLDRIALTDHNTAAGAFELLRLHPELRRKDAAQ